MPESGGTPTDRHLARDFSAERPQVKADAEPDSDAGWGGES